MTQRCKKQIVAGIALLAMGLSFLSQVTPLWLKRVEGKALLICTTFGIEQIIIDENGNKIPAPIKLAKNHCVMCLNASNNLALITQFDKDDLLPSRKISAIVWRPDTALSKHLSTRLAHAIRAPPVNT